MMLLASQTKTCECSQVLVESVLKDNRKYCEQKGLSPSQILIMQEAFIILK